MVFGKTIKLIVLAFLTMAAILLLGQTTQARNADGVLGQTVSEVPVYDKGLADNAVPNAGGMSYPGDTAIDEVNHYLFVSDYGFHRILIFQLDANNTFTGTDHLADYVLGRSSLTSYATTIQDRSLSGVRGLAFDSVRNYLYAADTTNNRVVVFDGSDGWTNGEAAINVYGQTSLTATAAASCSQSGLSSPYNVTYNSASDTIFVSEHGNNRVVSFPATTSTPAMGTNAINVIGQTSFTSCSNGSTTSTLYGPTDLAINTTTNKLYVADSHNGRVMVFDLSSLTDGMNAAQVFGKPSFTNVNSGRTTSTMFRNVNNESPGGVTIDTASNTLYVTDTSNQRLLVFDASTTTVAGANAQNVLAQVNFTDGGTAVTTQSGFWTASGLNFSQSAEYIYVADSNNLRVMIFDLNSITNGENAVDGLGQLDGSNNPVYTTSYQHNTAPHSGGLNYPRSEVVDHIHHHLFSSDTTNNRILVFDLDNNDNLVDLTADHVIGQTNFSDKSSATAAGRFNAPEHLDFNAASSTLFVSDKSNHRVLVFDVNEIVDGEDAVNVFGQSDFVTGSSGVTQSKLSSPTGMGFDNVGKRIFVADFTNNRVMVFDTNTTTNGGPALNVLGQINFTSSTLATTQSGLYWPIDADYDTVSSTLYVTERGNNRISVYDLSGGITNGMNSSYVLGQPNFLTNTAGTTQATTSFPFAIEYASDQQKLFVNDYNNHRVMVFDGSDGWANGENAVGIIGKTSYTDTGYATTQSALQYPMGMEYDAAHNRLWVGDGYNYRILTFNLITLPTTTFDTGYLGVSFTTSVPTPNNYQETLSYAVNSGSLPTGLSLNTTTGVISGTPSATGTHSFDIRATETGTSGTYYDTQTFSITIDTPTITLTSASYSASEDALSSPFTLSITTSSAYDISVVFSIGDSTTANSSNYSYTTTTATIPAGSTTASVPLSILHNHVVEPNQTVSISISSPTNASLGAITSSALTIVNVDARGGGDGGDTTKRDPVLPPPITVITPVEPVPTAPTAPTTPPLFTPAQVKSTVTAMNKILATKRWPSFGSKGTAVNTVQQVLINLKYLKISKPTGNFLSMTKQAVKRFQKANKISTTGNVGPLTAAAMRRVVSK